MYADGVHLGEHRSAGSVTNFALSDDVTLLAMEGWNSGGPTGMIGFLSNGQNTGAHVRCTSTLHTGRQYHMCTFFYRISIIHRLLYLADWTSKLFDDSSWPNAIELGDSETNVRFVSNDEFSTDSKVIWTGTQRVRETIYCRWTVGRLTEKLSAEKRHRLTCM